MIINVCISEIACINCIARSNNFYLQSLIFLVIKGNKVLLWINQHFMYKLKIRNTVENKKYK